MASTTSPLHYLLFSSILISSLLLSPTSSSGKQSFRPKAVVIPVTKHPSTLQYSTTINQRTPLVPVDLTLDLGGQLLWVDCERGYTSSTYKPARCKSAPCSLAKANGCGTCFSSPKPGCNNDTCGVSPDNTVTGTATGGELARDVVSVQSTDGKNPGRAVIDKDFVFACGSSFLLHGLADGVKGMAGLGRTKVSLPSQFASSFRFGRKFALCLSNRKGVAFFGDGPFFLLPGKEISDSLTYTPLIVNPVSTATASSRGDPSSEYFVGIKSIQVNQKTINLNKTLLSINKKTGFGGTKISTVQPYTVLESSIFKALTDAFTREAAARNITRVPSVAPFDVCFSSKNVLGTRLGASVPSIYLVFQNENVVWQIFGGNSMVFVNDDVLCLGFKDGGVNPRTSIVIGGYQLEDHLVEFDLGRSRLGFSAYLLGRQTTCGNFNFTSN